MIYLLFLIILILLIFLKFLKTKEHFFNNNVNTNNIVLIQQFYIPSKTQKYNEIKYVLKKNVENQNINFIYLLNEKLYTNKELGIKSDKIKQKVIKHRLSYKLAFEFMKYLTEYKKKQYYFILSNSDIFLDTYLSNLYKLNLIKDKIILALLRYDYNNETNLLDCKLDFNGASWCQDTWIIHSNNLKYIKDFEKYDFHLGIAGCDNYVSYLLDKDNFKLRNIPKIIRTYHYDKTHVFNKKWNINANNNYSNSKIIPKKQNKFKNVIVDLSNI
jgi:hypothetical protein